MTLDFLIEAILIAGLFFLVGLFLTISKGKKGITYGAIISFIISFIFFAIWRIPLDYPTPLLKAILGSIICFVYIFLFIVLGGLLGFHIYKKFKNKKPNNWLETGIKKAFPMLQ